MALCISWEFPESRQIQKSSITQVYEADKDGPHFKRTVH